MNVFVSLLAGLAIFPVVFAFGFEPTEGPGLLFIVLPSVFSQMLFGEFFLSLFLILFLFATLTSSFSLFEIIVATFTANGRMERRTVAWITGFIVFLAGIPAALSSSTLQNSKLFGKNVFDATDYLVSNLMLPLGCLLIALFISFRMNKKRMVFNLESIDDLGCAHNNSSCFFRDAGIDLGNGIKRVPKLLEVLFCFALGFCFLFSGFNVTINIKLNLDEQLLVNANEKNGE